jgi:hypothetical protein
VIVGILPTMTYVVVRRRQGEPSYEIRESELTDRGPRSRSLASFRVLDEAALARARARALRPFDPATVRASAQRVGAPIEVAEPAERHARALLTEIMTGTPPTPALAALLRRELTSSYVPSDGVESMVPWIAATPRDRAIALRDLLDDKFPARPRPPLAFPRLRSVR